MSNLSLPEDNDVALMAHIMEQLGEDEREIMVVLGERLLDGQSRYGKFDLDSDDRDFQQEAFEEDCDWLVYRAAEVVRNRRK